MNRRTFLGLMSAPLLGATQRVVVLGGGLAGLCVAYELRKSGYQVTVLEAQLRPGGRVRTVRHPFAPGLYCEAGPEQIPSAHDLTLHYAREFNLSLLPGTVSGMRSLFFVGGKQIVANAQSDWPFALTPEERSLGYAGLRKKYITAAIEKAVANGWAQNPIAVMKAWDAQTPGAWLRSEGASKGASELLSLGFGAEFGSAASFLLHSLNTRGSNGSFRIEGGNDALPREFAKRVDIRYGAEVVGVSQNDREAHVVVRMPSGIERLAADHVVCAIPCPVIGKIFDEARLSIAKQTALREQSYSRTVKVFLQSKTRFWLSDGFSGNVTADLPIERLTPDPGTVATERGALTAYPIGAYTSALEQMSETERVTAAFRQAGQIFPALNHEFEGGLSHCWGLDPWQRGSFALHTPGQIGFLETLGGREGRIHFAGEHTSAWTGWMQGALESARRVVKEIQT